MWAHENYKFVYSNSKTDKQICAYSYSNLTYLHIYINVD